MTCLIKYVKPWILMETPWCHNMWAVYNLSLSSCTSHFWMINQAKWGQWINTWNATVCLVNTRDSHPTSPDFTNPITPYKFPNVRTRCHWIYQTTTSPRWRTESPTEYDSFWDNPVQCLVMLDSVGYPISPLWILQGKTEPSASCQIIQTVLQMYWGWSSLIQTSDLQLSAYSGTGRRDEGPQTICLQETTNGGPQQGKYSLGLRHYTL